MYGKLVDGAIEVAPRMIGNVANPHEETYFANGWKRVIDAPPEGNCRSVGWTENTEITRVYEAVQPSAVVAISKAKVAAAVDAMGKTAEFFAWLNSKAAYATAWFNGSPSVDYDPTANGGDLASLIGALGIAEEEVAALVAKVEEEEV